MTETQKPFVCAKEGCKMTFTNEDHLNVHEKKHDMALHLGIDGQNYVVADQTPTPTRFIRNCEEVGLFQDLQNINPFDETFRKATDLIKTGTLFLPETTVDDTLHTPNVFPHIEETTKPNKFSRNVSNENEFTVTTINNDILKLSDKESPEQNRNKDFESDNDDIEVLSLRSSSSSEQSDENDFIETNSDTLLSNKLDDGVNSNLTATVNNLSDVEIRTNRTLITIVQKDNCKKVESKEDLKSKLKDALHARVRSEHSKSDNENVNFCVLYNIPHSKQMQKKLLQHSKKIIATNEVRTKKLISTQEVTHVEEQIDDNISKKRMTDRDRQREINRVAQVRSRERKKVWIGQMEKEVKLLQDEKKELWLENQTLKQEVMWLKSMLLFHKDCPVSKDPEVIKEVNMLMKQFQPLEEKEKRIYPRKEVPIQPHPTNIIAVAPPSNPLLLQVPLSVDSIRIGTISTQPIRPIFPIITTVAPVSAIAPVPMLTPLTPVTPLPALTPISPITSVKTIPIISKQNSPILARNTTCTIKPQKYLKKSIVISQNNVKPKTPEPGILKSNLLNLIKVEQTNNIPIITNESKTTLKSKQQLAEETINFKTGNISINNLIRTDAKSDEFVAKKIKKN